MILAKSVYGLYKVTMRNADYV